MGENNDIVLEIVLPCYNPREGWATRILTSFEKISASLAPAKIGLILVNDGSTSGFTNPELDLLKEKIPGIQILSYSQNKGKGHALRTGIRETKAPFVIYTDVDFPYEEDSLIELFRKLERKEGAVVAGVRNDAYYDKVPAGRKRISKILRWMLRTFLRLQITDTQCGLKGFNEAGRKIFLSTTIHRFLFDLEFIFLASRDPKVDVKPCSVSLKPGIEFSKMSWRILLGESFNFIKIFFKGFFGSIFRRKKSTSEKK